MGDVAEIIYCRAPGCEQPGGPPKPYLCARHRRVYDTLVEDTQTMTRRSVRRLLRRTAPTMASFLGVED